MAHEGMTLSETMSDPTLRCHANKFTPGEPFWHEIGTYCEHGDNCEKDDAQSRNGFMVDWLMEKKQKGLF